MLIYLRKAFQKDQNPDIKNQNGKKEEEEESKKEQNIEKPNFNPSGILAKFTNSVK